MRFSLITVIVVLLLLDLCRVNGFKPTSTQTQKKPTKKESTKKEKNQLFDTAQDKWNNQLGQPLSLECDTENGEGIYEVRSIYHLRERDRQYRWQCHKVATEPLTDCTWSNEINDYRGSMLFMCPSNFVIAGVSSAYDGKQQDRQWKIKCCRADKHFTRACKLSSSVNRFGKPLYYASKDECGDPGVLTGLASEVNKKGKFKDREWKVMECAYANQESCKYECNSIHPRGKKKSKKNKKNKKKPKANKVESSPLEKKESEGKEKKILKHHRRKRRNHHTDIVTTNGVGKHKKHHKHLLFDRKEDGHQGRAHLKEKHHHMRNQIEKERREIKEIREIIDRIEEGNHRHRKHHHRKELADEIEAQPIQNSPQPLQTPNPSPVGPINSNNGVRPVPNSPIPGQNPLQSPNIFRQYSLPQRPRAQPIHQRPSIPGVTPLEIESGQQKKQQNTQTTQPQNGNQTPKQAGSIPIHDPAKDIHIDLFQQLQHMAQIRQPVPLYSGPYPAPYYNGLVPPVRTPFQLLSGITMRPLQVNHIEPAHPNVKTYGDVYLHPPNPQPVGALPPPVSNALPFMNAVNRRYPNWLNSLENPLDNMTPEDQQRLFNYLRNTAHQLHYYMPVQTNLNDIKTRIEQLLKQLQGGPIRLHHHIPAEPSKPENIYSALERIMNAHSHETPTNIHIYLPTSDTGQSSNLHQTVQHVADHLPGGSEIHYHVPIAEHSIKVNGNEKNTLNELLANLPKNSEIHYHLSPSNGGGDHTTKTFSRQPAAVHYNPPMSTNSGDYKEKYKELVEKLRDLFTTENRVGQEAGSNVRPYGTKLEA